MIGKLHFRKLTDGRYYMHGVITEKNWHTLSDEMSYDEPVERLDDFIAVAEIDVERETIKDKSDEFTGKHTLDIIEEGF